MDSAACVISSRHFPMMGRICRSTSANVFSDSPTRSILFSSIAWIFCSRHTHTELVWAFLNPELRDQESLHAKLPFGVCLCCCLICIIHNSEFRNNACKQMMILQAIHSQWMFPCMCVHLENIRDGGVIMFVLLLVELLQVWGIFILAVRSHLVSHLSLLPSLKERERMKYYWLCNIIVLIIHLKTLKHMQACTRFHYFLHLPTSLRQHSHSE